jgi:hypothetical protein
LEQGKLIPNESARIEIEIEFESNCRENLKESSEKGNAKSSTMKIQN